MKVPGVFLCLLFPAVTLAECGGSSGESFEVARVSDGDTLKLKDGRSVRLLGVNAPEITHGKNAAQPYGRESRVAAQAFVDRAQGLVQLGFERELHDHYGRLLAHVYDSHGRSLAVAQLRAGMALHIAVPPNIAYATCLQEFEQSARQRQVGLWRESYWQPQSTAAFAGDEIGFRYVRGRITKVSINSAVWLELEGKLVVRVSRKDWPLFTYKKSDWLALKGRVLELRGWITQQKSIHSPQFKPLVMGLRSPSSMKVSGR